MRVFTSPDELPLALGEDLGVSPWHVVDQRQIDGFAAATGDHQWIHVDAERARTGPFGGTIAHGFLTVALLPLLLGRIARVDGVDVTINAGLDRLRFHSPVPSGARVRARAELSAVRHRGGGFTEIVLSTSLEIEGRSRPAVTADVLALLRAAKPAPAH
ncbi:MaoC family dehydratase [Streptomyces spectabilis]|uniref:Acyl dehydratase n=1 Tax=Streptomyces spectabilis TaxID=68270 RepID=A0A5P2X3D3_STRST|nr:MaoC family dehydratase [Streptomyces spectabilis]MBB5100979.1 acyl dehydratase [Streptomyces spectabilis]MCI3900192.1 MaoC family dehydratase [Streptomyces spectabilis]QEV57799.1 MaoC family dehydratase [Streptomyces spectabilis]GGV08812.1 MaoC family dehydratase [Streptomyces spectabilis]